MAFVRRIAPWAALLALAAAAPAWFFWDREEPTRPSPQSLAAARQQRLAAARTALDRLLRLSTTSPGFDAALAEAETSIEECITGELSYSEADFFGPVGHMVHHGAEPASGPEPYLLRARLCLKKRDDHGVRDALEAARRLNARHPEIAFIDARLRLIAHLKSPQGDLRLMRDRFAEMVPHEKSLLEGLLALVEERRTDAAPLIAKFLEVEAGDDEIASLK